MKESSETFKMLWDYCTANNRVVPMPQEWNALYQMLKNTQRNSSGGWIPTLPLILGAWHDSPALFKQLRSKEHIEWAEENGQLQEIDKYLRSLKEDDLALLWRLLSLEKKDERISTNNSRREKRLC